MLCTEEVAAGDGGAECSTRPSGLNSGPDWPWYQLPAVADSDVRLAALTAQYHSHPSHLQLDSHTTEVLPALHKQYWSLTKGRTTCDVK
jgi:hypothetical protein